MGAGETKYGDCGFGWRNFLTCCSPCRGLEFQYSRDYKVSISAMVIVSKVRNFNLHTQQPASALFLSGSQGSQGLPLMTLSNSLISKFPHAMQLNLCLQTTIHKPFTRTDASCRLFFSCPCLCLCLCLYRINKQAQCSLVSASFIR